MTPASGERVSGYRPDPVKEGIREVEKIENEAIAKGKTTPAEIAEEVRKSVKRDVELRSGEATATRLLDNKRGGGLSGEDTEAVNVAATVSSFMEAVNKGYIIPPTHLPTRAVYDSLVDKLKGNIDLRTAAYLQPLIHGVLNIPDYVQLTPGSQFQQDLDKLFPGFENDPVYNMVNNILLSSTLPAADRLTIADKLKEIKKVKEREIEGRKKAQKKDKGGFSEAEQTYIDEMFLNDHTPIAEDIKEKLLPALESADKFHVYYKQTYTDIYNNLEEKDPDTARRDATMYMHKCFMYLTHRIFSQVIEGAGHTGWNDLVRDTSRGYGTDAQRLFTHVKRLLTEIQHDVKLFGDFNFIKETDGKEVADPHAAKKPEIFYQLGLEKISAMEMKKDDKGNIIMAGVRDIPVISSELEKIDSFKEFVERFTTAMGAERDLLEVGINFNYLLNTGHTEEGKSFFKQAAAYAQHSLNAGRIDELYRLPYNEVVHTARIQLANQLKLDLAMGNWLKDPKMFTGLFQHSNTAEHHVLIDMIKSELGNKDVPEWAIRRAIIHARMHMSLISLDYHAISSYGHPYLTDKLKPTFTDTAMAGLETFNTWWEGTKWGTKELARYGLAFMPAANRQWMQDVWLPEDISAEGEKIFQNSKHIGQLSLRGRTYFTPKTPLNIMELNPMGVGGVEKQSGWGIKYPYTPWIDDLIDQPTSFENFHMKHAQRDTEGKIVMDKEGKPIQDYRDMEIAWKRLENLGIEILRNFKDTYLFGLDDKFLELKGGEVAYTKHYEKFFTFLFDRYFKEGIGNEALTLEYRNKNLEMKKIKYSDFKEGKDFWDKVVEPILNKPDIIGKNGINPEDPDDAEKRNLAERRDLLKKIINQALGVIMFERLPVDMVLTEDPLRSQNGKTFIQELELQFVTNNQSSHDEVGHHGDNDHAGHNHGHDGKMDITSFKHAFADLNYVQGLARTKSVEEIKKNLKSQRIDKNNPGRRPEGFSTYGKTLNDFDNVRSTIKISDEQDGIKSKTGYIIDENIVRDFLTDKYTRIMNTHATSDVNTPADVKHHVENAVNLYRAIRQKIKEKPEYSYYEENCEKLVDDEWAERQIKFEKQKGDLQAYEKTPAILEAKKKEIQARLKKDFENHRANGMQSRFAWSAEHLLDPKVPITINDVAYPLLYFSSTGELLVNRRLDQIAGTQEQYKSYIMGDYDSDLKKYYRKEDQGPLLEHIIGIRSAIKDWLGPEDYNGIAMFILENSMNVMRIRSDAENMLVETQMRMNHKRRSAISSVATEGDQYPLRRQERFAMVSEFMHSGQFPKYTDPKDRVYDVIDKPRRESIKKAFEKLGKGKSIEWVGEKIANFADLFMGKDEAAMVRQGWKERSGNALRDRQIANVMNLVAREGLTFVGLLLAAIMILSVVQGYKAAEEK